MITIKMECELSKTDDSIDLTYSVQKDGVFIHQLNCKNVSYDEMKMIDATMTHVRKNVLSAIKESHPEYKDMLREEMDSIKNKYQQPQEPFWKRVLMDMRKLIK